MIFEIGNFYYYLTLVLMLLSAITLLLILRNKSLKVKKIILLSIAIFNFLLHFLKIFHPSYLSDIKTSLVRMSVENICALSTVILPFAMISKNKMFKSYIYLISFLGGLMAVVISAIPAGQSLLEFESIRYYVCHYILFCVPLVACLTKEFIPNHKYAIWMPFMFTAGQIVILLNEIILWKTGLISHDIASFLSANVRNPSFVFGPNGSGEALSDILLYLVPDIFEKNIFGIEGVGDFYWPVVWLFVPSILLFPIGYILLTLPFNYKELKFRKK